MKDHGMLRNYLLSLSISHGFCPLCMVSQLADSPFLWMRLSTAFSQMFISRPGGMNCCWESKCLAPMLVMQLMGCDGKLKAIDTFLSWLLLCGNICFTFSFLELHLCSVNKHQGEFRLLGRCIPPSSGVLEWHRGKVKSQLLLICTFLLHPLNCTTKSEAMHSPSQKIPKNKYT